LCGTTKDPEYSAKVILKENKAGVPDVELYDKAMVIKTVYCWSKNRHIHWWTRTEGLEIIFHIYVPLIFHKGTKSIQWGKDLTSQHMIPGQLDLHMQKTPTLLHTQKLTQNGSQT